MPCITRHWQQMRSGSTRRPLLPWESVSGVPCTTPETHVAGVRDPVRGGSWAGSEAILIIDDQPPIREWLMDLLAPLGVAVVAARSGDEALALVRADNKLQIRAALCDLFMPHAAPEGGVMSGVMNGGALEGEVIEGGVLEGIEAARILWYDHGIPCLMLSRVEDARARLAALYAGAFGYLCKDRAHGAMVRTSVASLLAGRPLREAGFHLAVSTADVRHVGEQAAAYARAMEQLTPHQRVVAQLLAEGKTNREIAAQLVLSRGTVNSHVSHILERLNLSNRREVKSRVRFTSGGYGRGLASGHGHGHGQVGR